MLKQILAVKGVGEGESLKKEKFVTKVSFR